VHNLPPFVTEEVLVSFFNLQLNGLNVIRGLIHAFLPRSLRMACSLF